MRKRLWNKAWGLLPVLLVATAFPAPSRAAGSGTLVVLNKAEATAWLVDVETGLPSARLPTGQGPHEVDVSPDGRMAVVTDYGGRGEPGSTLTVIDIPAGAVLKTINLGDYRRPHGIQWLADGRRVVVTAEANKALLTVDIQSGRVTGAIETGAEISHMVGVTPDGKRAFVANIGSGSVSALDLESQKLIRNVPTGEGAEGIAITPDGREVWVTNRAADTVTVLDTRSLDRLAELPSPSFPIRATVTPDGRHVLVSNAKTADVTVFDARARKEIRRIAMKLEASETDGRLFGDTFGESSVPIGILIEPGGKTAWVANANADRVTVLDLDEWKAIGILATGKEPDGLGFSPRVVTEPQGVSRPLPVGVYRDMASGVSPSRLEDTVRTLVSFRTRHTASTDDQQGEGILASARWLEQEMLRAAAEGPMTVMADAYTAESSRLAAPTPARNVLALIPAESPWGRDRYVVVAGHYDSRASDVTDFVSDAPGANDDASGTAVVVELAHILAGVRFDANVLLACVSGEEQGLLGSRHLARRASDQGWAVRAMITNDIVGNSLGQNGQVEAHRMRVFSEGVRSGESDDTARRRVRIGGENDSPSRQLSRHIAMVVEGTFQGFDVLQVFRRDRLGRGGDHIPFLAEGFPAVRFTEVNEHFERQHQDVREEGSVQYGDLPDFVDFEYLARVARANVAVVVSLANAPGEPANVLISPGVSPDTFLSWDPVPDGDLAGYEVIWRETASPAWQQKRFVPVPDTEITLSGVTVDNFFFAVRAVDREGNRSIAVFPTGRLDT